MNLAIGAHNLAVFFEVAVVGIAVFAVPAKDVLGVIELAHTSHGISNDAIVTLRTHT